MTNRRVHARGIAEGTSHGTARPCDPTTPAIARALDRAHNLSRLRDEIETSDRLRADNDRNANTEVLDFMQGGMTRRHEGCVSTMLTDKRLEYCTADAPLQGSG